ncbi:MAG: GxxExxY protein [Planctomycetota bacterium]|nr:GxxExxY protein [Planctomycetota bacterium]
MTREDELSNRIIGAAIEVHKHLGPGLLESAYEEAMAFELTEVGLAFERQAPLPVVYKNVRLDCGYRLDFLVEGLVIVEIKSVDSLLPIHDAQCITYLRMSGCKLCLLINFNVRLLKDGIKRIVLNL